MIIVLSPAKTLDYLTPPTIADCTEPVFLDDAEELIGILRRLSPAEVASLMQISDPLATLNAARYADWRRPFTPENAKQAVLAFNGDVYEGLDAVSLPPADLRFAQDRLRILSGLYGLLRPLDLIQPYRLEMGTRLANARGRDLYAFWGRRIGDALASALRDGGGRVLINLASEEYFRAIRPQDLPTPLIQPVFEDWSGGRFRVVSFHAKRARGLMARFAVLSRLADEHGLKDFAGGGYAYSSESSTPLRWVFRRRQKT
ncbi:peroxide stress protein YaaA [Accumulibacter sp.]|uniref:peroxide stress protein YaaA n=1 Tax=Accumulibacter sp. TaxID=2053492 RepID=UPI0025FAD8FC|nr:peroxide stress protein YaaA [Accumulibacter sp.]MCM8595084.1 peroxide stress protein YaaA [Accumulibacter sp.]MCM8625467.1 peroxide stress protein YaaA [Accumulibacter sp.]MDS4049230.1 peroxide stress protein YaaA [Accumulibacter sp.]